MLCSFQCILCRILENLGYIIKYCGGASAEKWVQFEKQHEVLKLVLLAMIGGDISCVYRPLDYP